MYFHRTWCHSFQQKKKEKINDWIPIALFLYFNEKSNHILRALYSSQFQPTSTSTHVGLIGARICFSYSSLFRSPNLFFDSQRFDFCGCSTRIREKIVFVRIPMYLWICFESLNTKRNFERELTANVFEVGSTNYLLFFNALLVTVFSWIRKSGPMKNDFLVVKNEPRNPKKPWNPKCDNTFSFSSLWFPPRAKTLLIKSIFFFFYFSASDFMSFNNKNLKKKFGENNSKRIPNTEWKWNE